MSTRTLVVVVLALSVLGGCSSIERARDSLPHWAGGRGEPASGPASAGAPPSACAPPVPVPPPMPPPPAPECDEGPIPAPCGPPPASVVWPPPNAACPPPVASAPVAAGLSADVTDVTNPRAWSLIVIHHSASKIGGAARFDQWHRAKGWEGVGYDFVIGNGTDTGDGVIETTFRWKEQKDGAHVKGWNEMAIGVCLVGNFEETDPTPAQRDSLSTLVRYLRGRFTIPRERVLGHGQLNATACPGKRFSVRDVAAATDPAPATGRSP